MKGKRTFKKREIMKTLRIMKGKKYNKVITPFLIVGILGVPGCLLSAFYYLVIAPEGGMVLAGVLFSIAFVAILFVTIVEQGLILFKKGEEALEKRTIKIIWIIEVVIICIVLFLLRNGIG